MKVGIKIIKKNFLIWAVALITVIEIGFFSFRSNNSRPSSAELPLIDYWKKFELISKEEKYFEDLDAYYRVPVFTNELIEQEKSKKEIALTGFFLPYSDSDSVIIISRYPNSSCFFCGKAGIESVAMVELEEVASKSYRMDEFLLVKGKLSLNTTDPEKLAFVLSEATVQELGL